MNIPLDRSAGDESPMAISAREQVWIEGGTFVMGSDRHYPEEAPAHPAKVDGFWIDVAPVTNRQFAEFVAATGYVTLAESPSDPKDYPGAPAHMMKAGSVVFDPPKRITSRDPAQWWNFKFGANWRRPYGGLSNLRGKLDHPVLQIAYADAKAYAAWAGKDLPTEAEWEFAAKGGLESAEFAWGDELVPDGRFMANTWHGVFPIENLKPDGFERTSPVGSFPPNGYGLYDMIGNVWEWTNDYWSSAHPAPAQRACCIPANPRGGSAEESFDPTQPQIRIARRVVKGGSHLCAPNYCRRYRPAARHAQEENSATTHIGFRCVRRP
ncbi:formylglycine-generating enzyme required for sulfatase activity [Ensifer mexicanus]|nr:formylglycine-generating enzyme family protein [Sinorhizobium mexicanum]MBP1886846.1 formylglycine-generating enzyme required for sulfatase activity [Sinorhizobium mexicanum]